MYGDQFGESVLRSWGLKGYTFTKLSYLNTVYTNTRS